jgi:hypothetical protein
MIVRILLGLLISAPMLGASSPVAQFSSIYQRATNHFVTAHLLKPSLSKEQDVTLAFAPLIVQEASGDEPLRTPFGELSLSNGVLSLDTSKPTIYVYADQVKAGSTAHPRFTYLWCYSVDPKLRAKSPLALQGVRITTDSSGAPVIWEVLADQLGFDLVFVAESLERTAAAQAKIQPGRRFAVEPPLRKFPRLVVPRVISDGPVPMGPILYLDRNSHSVSALVCRCMPSQAKSVLTASTYQLRPIQYNSADVLLQLVRDRAKLKTSFWPERNDPIPLEQRLQLPASF